MHSALLVSAFAAIVAAQTTAGGFANVYSDLQKLTGDLGALGKTVNAPGCNTCAYTNNQVESILSGTQQITWDMGNATEAVGNTTSFSSANSQQLESYVGASLYPAITSLLNDFKAHQSAFVSQSMGPFVSYFVAEQKTAAASLVHGFVTKVAPVSATTQAIAYSTAIQSAFASCTAVYN